MIHKSLIVLALTTLAGLAAPSFAQDNQPKTPETNATAPGQPSTPAPAIPIPDGPVVNRQELPGGLIIEDIKIGTGYEVKPMGSILAHYHGTLKADGKVFQSSFQTGQPFATTLSTTVEGWQKGVPGMKVGGVRRLTIPAAMGWAERGVGGLIPPNADVVFLIELVDALQVEDVKVGEGEEISGQCVAVTTFTITDESGKELEKATAANPYIWFPNEYQPIAFGLEGMKPGGKRKIIAPKGMTQASPMGVTHPVDQKVILEVELLAARNLQPKAPAPAKTDTAAPKTDTAAPK